jgi:hypothetical protein
MEYTAGSTIRPVAGGSHRVVGLNERVVDGHDIDFIVLDGISEDDTTDTAETVDANLGRGHAAMAEVSGGERVSLLG